MTGGKSVRLRYSGLVNFAASFISLVLGLAFTVLLTRKLSVEEYGVWHVIGTVAMYAGSWMPSIYTYWAVRDVSRGKTDSAKTSVASGFIFGVVSLPLFLILSFFFSSSLKIPMLYFLIFSPYVLLFLIYNGYHAISAGVAPQHIGFSDAFSMAFKLSIGFLLLVLLNMKLVGAIMALIVYIALRTLYMQMKFGYLVTKGRFKFNTFKRWLTLSWIPLTRRSIQLLSQVDIAIVALVTGSTVAIAHYRAIWVFLSLITLTTTLASGLYPSILASEDERKIEKVTKETANLVFLFSFPMIVISAVMSDYLLALLRIDYVSSCNAMRIAMVYAFIFLLSEIYRIMLIGTEKIDVDEKTPIKLYMRSRLFSTTIATLATPIVVIPTVFLASAMLRQPILIVELWYVAYTVAILCRLLLFLRMAKAINLEHVLDFKVLLTMALSAVIGAIVLRLVTPYFFGLSERFVESLKGLVFISLLGITIYFLTLYPLSAWFRKLVKDALTYIRSQLSTVFRG